MSGPNDWNPEDGPPPTDEELREAAEFDRALSAVLPEKSQTEPKSSAPTKLSEGSLALLLDVALRAHATEHPPSAAQTDRAVRAAIEQASAKRRAPGPARRWLVRVSAAAAVLIAGIVGGRVAQQRAQTAPASDVGSISRPADDVFTSALGPEPGSDPITRIERARMRDFRGHLFARGGRAR